MSNNFGCANRNMAFHLQKMLAEDLTPLKALDFAQFDFEVLRKTANLENIVVLHLHKRRLLVNLHRDILVDIFLPVDSFNLQD
ncbi:MAG: hypothetical protein IJS29_09085 [Selenomonadaceae bacterium]|nr:hypothetical protein [Selenomonadaceae bacterium]